MRRTQSIATLTVLLWGFTQAPFAHIHPEEESDHTHAQGFAHVHFQAHHDDEGSQWDHAEDEDAIDVAWGILTPPNHSFHFDSEGPVQPVVIEADITKFSLLETDCLHSHDPPVLESQNPRPPPA